MEIRPIPRLPGYFASSNGAVFRGDKEVSHYTNTKGYLVTGIWHNGKSRCFGLHRLVLEAFVGPCPRGMQACHWDGDPSNNHISNLRWDTQRGNWKDRVRHGRIGARYGEDNPFHKLTNSAVIFIVKNRNAKTNDLCRKFGVNPATIQRVRNGDIWSHVSKKIKETSL